LTPIDYSKSNIDSKVTPIDSELTPIDSSKSNKRRYECQYCQKSYSKSCNLTRHLKKCPQKEEYQHSSSLMEIFKSQIERQTQQIEAMRQEHAKEKAELYKQMEKLLERVGNNTNNTYIKEQKIIVNSFGQENLDYLHKEYLHSLLKIPFSSVPKLLKDLHFHPKHPENHNVKITNKKLPYASVWKDEKWETRDKKKVITDMVDNGYHIIDSEFSPEELEDKKKSNYYTFSQKYQEKEKALVKSLVQDTEVMIITESKNLNTN
jgi:hypothetical protein